MRRFKQDPDCVFAERFISPQDCRDRGFTISGNPGVENSPYGHALTLAGGTPDYLALDDATYIGDLIGTGDFSIVAAIKNSATLAGTANKYTIIADKDQPNTTKIGFAFILAGGSLNGLQIRLNDATNANDMTLSLSTDRTTLLSNGNWHTVGVSVDRGTIADSRLYVNSFSGEYSAAGDAIGANTLSNDQDLTLGTLGNKITYPATLSVAYVLIYKRILSAAEFGNFHTGEAF